MKTVLGILYFCLCIGHCQVVAVYPMCGQPSSSMSGCCMLSQGSLRCTEVTCPDGYYKVVSSSTCSDSETSLEDNEVPAQKDTPVPHQRSNDTLAPSLSTTTPQSVSDESKDDVSANQSDSDAASFKPLTSEAPGHLLENTPQKAPPFPLMAEDNSSNVTTSLSSVTPVTSPHVFCCQCHESCLTCSDKGPKHCLSCAPDFDWWSTNTTGQCLMDEALLDGAEHFDPLIILIIIPISFFVCPGIVVFIYLRRQTRMSRKQAGVECGQSFILSESHISLSWRDTSFLPSPIISTQWQISEDFPWSGGVLKATSSGVCLEVGQGAVDITDKVTIHGAVSTDLTNAYDVLPLPEDEVIVSPIAEFFAGFYFRFEKPVRIVLPHFLSSDLPGHLVRVYEFHSENGRIQCCRLQVINTDEENPVETGYLFCGSNREIHVFTNHFSGYVCTVCEEACTGYYKPPEVTLRALAKHVLRSNGKREVIVRLDLWDSRFFSPDIQQRRQRTEVSTEDRQMVLVAERKLKSLDDSPDVGNAFIGARFHLSEEQRTYWSHVKTDGVNVCPMEQILHVKELYPCRHQRPHNSMKWMLSDAKTNAPQEFECFIFVGYIDSGTPIAGSSFANDQQKIIFMEYPQSVILPIRRAMKLDEDHPDSIRPLEQTAHGSLAEAKPSQTTHSENTNVKNLASLLQSSSLDSQTSSVNISQGCSMLRHESHSGHVRELSDTSSANPFSIQHVNSISSLKLYVYSSTTPTRDDALGDLVFGAESVDTLERHSSLRSSVNHNMTSPTPASDQ